MSSHTHLYQRVAVVGVIDPDANTAATYLTAAIDMQDWRRVLFIVQVGDIATNGTVDFTVTASATSGGSYALVTGKSITQLTEAGTDSNKQVLLEVRADEVLTAGKRYIKGQLVTGTAAADSGVIAIGEPAHYGPANDNDLTTVDEIVF